MLRLIKKHFLVFIFISIFLPLRAANLTINTTSQQNPISPYIYGLNQQLNGDENITVMRLGGNRMTGYNWENNASNAGSDYYDSSDNYMCGAENVSAANCTNRSGAVYEAFVNYNLSHNYDSLVTIPMAGYVAADMNGDVTAAQTAPSSRWHPIYYSKGSAFAYPPDTTDDAVYMDESVWHLTQDYGLAGSAQGIKFYMLDNEPGIWDSTHPYLHPLTTTCVELVSDSTNLGMAIKNVDPNSMVFGGVFYGWMDYISLNGAPDWATQGAGYNWFVSYFLKKMKDAETANGGKRILDDIDFHYYSEATNGTCRVTDTTCSGYPTNTQTERMNATRTLYEAGYYENSWVGEWEQAYLPLIPLIIASINTYYPGTKFSFSEWNFGAGAYISGGLADVDALGIFGKYGAYLATMWSVDEGGYSSSAFKMYRNYDGSNSTFGNTSVAADTDSSTMTVYASINGTDVSQLHLIIVNKYPTAQTANVTITSPEPYASMMVYGFDQTSYTITARSTAAISSNSFSYSMPAYSTMHFILKSNVTPTNTPNWTATPTFTITQTSSITQTSTITPTFTVTPVATSVIIYDGDTAGATIADGTIHSTSPGVMSQTTGGDPGNMMLLTYTNATSWWEQHYWVLNNPKSTAGEMYLSFNVRQDPSSPYPVVQFDVGIDTTGAINLDVSGYTVGGGPVTTAWKTVLIPLSALLDAGQTSVTSIAFTDNYTDDYTVDIDNVMLVPAAATPTQTPQNTSTFTQTVTATATKTSTPTLTRTPTFTQTLFVTATMTPSVTATITGTPPTVTVTPTITQTFTFTQTVTMTGTPTVTQTNQPTFTFTPTLTATRTFTGTATPTFTPTLPATQTFTATATPTAAAGTPGVQVVVYPNPLIAGKNPLSIAISSAQKPSKVKLRIYTSSFRLVHEAVWDSSGITGNYAVTETPDKFANLGGGSYYFVVFVTDQQNKVTRSKANPLIILR